MRFQRGIHYPHPQRGRGRKPYTVSEAALRQRCRNLRRARLRSDRESRTIKLLIWQSCFEDGPRPSQRALARELRVWPSYVCKVQKQSSKGLDALASGRRVTFDDLAEARRTTERIRQEEPGLLGPRHTRATGMLGSKALLGPNAPRVMTANEGIAEQRDFAEEWKRRNPPRYDTRRRISVPILR
jgi:hypothetical protein